MREIDGVGASTLEDFAAGKADLSVEALKALTKVLYPHSEFDVESGMLRSANKTAISKPANYPPPLGDPTLWPTYRGPRQPEEQPSNVLPPSPPPRKKRAGSTAGPTKPFSGFDEVIRKRTGARFVPSRRRAMTEFVAAAGVLFSISNLWLMPSTCIGRADGYSYGPFHFAECRSQHRLAGGFD